VSRFSGSHSTHTHSRLDVATTAHPKSSCCRSCVEAGCSPVEFGFVWFGSMRLEYSSVVDWWRLCVPPDTYSIITEHYSVPSTAHHLAECSSFAACYCCGQMQGLPIYSNHPNALIVIWYSLTTGGGIN
jgi:hypothetical protein